MFEEFAPEWEGFTEGRWSNTAVNVRDFIQRNYTPYDGDDQFLAGPTEATKQLWAQVSELAQKEREAGGVLDMDTEIISTITSHSAGYLNRDLEKIVGLQTDKPFKRALQPFGGIRMAQQACKEYGYEVDPKVVEIFTKYRKTHNQGVFDVYTPEMRLARKSAILTGLPDAYGRGRIIGDYRRVALYGIDMLIEDKEHQKATHFVRMTSENIRLREELSEQIRALEELKEQAQALCTMVVTVLDAHLLRVQQDTLQLINRKTEFVSQTEDQMTRSDDETRSRVQEQLDLYRGDMDSLIHDQQEYAVGLASAISIVKDIKKDIAAAADKDAVMTCVESIHEKTKFAYIFSNRAKETKHE